jgi:trehalose-phosphatase
VTASRTSSEIVDILLKRLVHAPHRALFFDYDGTLAEYAPRPELATLQPPVRDVLAHLASFPSVSLGVISSRRLQEVFDLVGVEGVRYAGLTGLEVREPDGSVRRHPALDASRPALDAVVARLERELSRFSGAWIEDKDGALALHCRDVEIERISELGARVRAIVEPDDDRLRLEVNAFTFEVWPRVDTNKGVALDAFLAEVPANALALYAGDDTNDMPAMQRVRSARGLAVGVGPRAPSAAEYRLPSPVDLHALLERLLRDLEANA